MTDANSQFFAILTNVGKAKQANADALGIPWKITDMAVGDANNIDPVIPTEGQTKLINEWRRRPLNRLFVDPVNPAVLIAEQVIPADEGGRWIREIGLYDADGDLVAVANCAPSFKPLLSQGSGRTQIVRMNFIVTSTGNIQLKIDPAVVLATREYVEQRIMEELYRLDSKQSVLVATTGNIALTGLQTIDGIAVPADGRVLVKNQTLAKDNGIWVASAGAWVRAADADSNAEVTSALLVSVEQGLAQADSRWQLVTDGTITVGVTPLTFMDVTNGFARLFSPAFGGDPTGPTPAQFNSSLSLATTEFVKRAGVEYSGFSSSTTNQIFSEAHVGGLHSFSGVSQVTVTLPPTESVAQAATITLVCAGAGGLNVLAAGTDVISTTNGTTGALLMALGETAEFIRVSGQWRLFGGSSALRFANSFTALLTANGYQRTPSGLIEQWGVVPAIPANSSILVTYPIAFPNTAVGFSAVGGGSGAGVPGINVTSVSATQIRFWNQSTTVATQAGGYRVVGY